MKMKKHLCALCGLCYLSTETRRFCNCNTSIITWNHNEEVIPSELLQYAVTIGAKYFESGCHEEAPDLSYLICCSEPITDEEAYQIIKHDLKEKAAI